MKIIILLLFFTLFSYAQNEAEIATTLDNWHKAASEAKYETYFSYMSASSVFIGTDATENWNKSQFMAYAKPFFDKGKAWSFTALQRNIYLSKDKKIAWFDELLNTQMKICRGSGVMIKIGKIWKIQHYTLSMTIPNENVNDVVKTKTLLEDVLINKLQITN
jgi:hypothetical protein